MKNILLLFSLASLCFSCQIITGAGDISPSSLATGMRIIALIILVVIGGLGFVLFKVIKKRFF